MRPLSAKLAAVALSALAAGAAASAKPQCPPDSVRAGTVCIDKYEASLWLVPDPTSLNQKLVRKIQDGSATLVDLVSGEATQLPTDGPYPAFFPGDGDWTPLIGSSPPTPGVYAVSIARVTPNIASWFQADQACALADKRLPSNYEWQVATAGTPDPGVDDDHTTTCNTATFDALAATGSRSACVSAWGAHDTVGNVAEWVADWSQRSSTSTLFFGDLSAFGGSGLSVLLPEALVRGGGGTPGDLFVGFQGSFAVVPYDPTTPNRAGFRCAR